MNERDIFFSALEIADPIQRAEFLAQACGGSAELRAKVEQLLESHAISSQFLETPAAEESSVAQTLLSDGSHDEVDSERASAEAEFQKYLQPATRPGWLGRLGHYEIESILGRGAFGIVAKAFDEKLHRVVAIKMMSPELASTSPPRKRFLREARTAAAVTHENVVAIYAVEEEPIPYLVMEYVPGQTLQQRMDGQGPLEVPEILRIAQLVAAGLAAAHAVNLIHRDIKPSNILLMEGPHERAKISDFGLARAVDDASMTSSGMIAGTPLYMAPEQARGEILDHRADLFSLGSVLYQMASGRPPFRAANTVAVLKRVCEDTPRPLNDVIPGTPAWLETIIFKLLEKSPEDRFQSAREVADLLGRCQSELQLNGQVTCVNNERAGAVSAPSAPTDKVPATPVYTKGDEWKQFSPGESRIWRIIFPAGVFIGGLFIVSGLLTKNIGWWPPALGIAVIVLAFMQFRRRVRQIRLAQGAPATAPPQKITWKHILVAVLTGVFVMFPILYGKHLSHFISPFFWGENPALPVVERAAGLRFDGQDDFIQIPIEWDTPVFTIEAFVTPDDGVPSGTLLHLSNEQRAKIESIELFDEQNQSSQPESYVGVVGGKSQGYMGAPLQRGVRQHRALTYDGQHLHYFVNGMWQAKRRVQPEDQLLWKLRQLTIGCKQDRTNFFAGVIDQIRLSKVARYTENFPPVTSVTSDDSTLALYDFDEGTGDVLQDSSGNGHNGKILGATWVHPARGLQFDGVDDYVDFDNLAWSSNQYTFEMWITPQAEHGTLFQIAVPEGNLHAYLYEGGSGTGMYRDKPYTNVNGNRQGLKRQHLATVFDGQNLNYFINGKLVGTKSNISELATPWTFQRLRIGGKLDPTASKPEFFHGRMDQFRVSTSALYVLPFTPAERLTAEADTLALYNFDENQGDILTDVTRHGHNGKIVGASWVQASGAASAPREPSLAENLQPPKTPGWHGWPVDAPAPAIAPFDAAQAKAHQEAWAKYLGVPVEYTNSIGMKFRLIPPGEFTMGGTPEEINASLEVAAGIQFWSRTIPSEGPQHKVVLTQPIYFGVTQVTQTQYEQVIGTNPSHFSATGEGQEMVVHLETGDHPVETVSWNDAAEFCAKLSQREQLKPFYLRADDTVAPLDETGYRLPTEAEWENACRAGTTTWFWGGNEHQDLLMAGWVEPNSGSRTHPVGELKANPFGLFDVHGNVWEWVQDNWDPEAYSKFKENPAIDPYVPFYAATNRVARGGVFYDNPTLCRSSVRQAMRPSHRSLEYGFRVVLPVDAVKKVLALKSPVATAGSSSSANVTWHGWPTDAPAPAIVPFDADQAEAHQEAWAKYLGVPVEYTNSIGMKFRLIPPGEFLMGSTPEEIEEALKFVGDVKVWQEHIESEAPQHPVILTQPIYLGVFEVTQAEYEKVMGVNPSHFAPMGNGKEAVAGLETAEHPVEMVSWNDAAEFCAKLSQQEKLKPFYSSAGETITPLDGTGYRLPSEAEWEFACRAGTATKYWTGDKDEDLVQAGWLDRNSGDRTHATGELRANPFGLFDIHGNVWERVQDGWDATYYGQFSEKAAINPNNPFSAGSVGVIRGGNWQRTASTCRSSKRNDSGTTHRDNRIGFRVSLPIDAVKQELE